MKNIYVNMITTSIKLKKQLAPTCNFFLLLEHFKQNKKCKNADNISSSTYGMRRRSGPLLCPHVEEEILLNKSSKGGDREEASTKGGDLEEAASKGGDREEVASEGLQSSCHSTDLNFSYKNRNIYNH